MSSLFKSDIFFVNLLYIIKLIVITLFLLNFNEASAEEILLDAEPFEIWGQSTNHSIPQLENSNLEEEFFDEEVLESESNSSESVIKSDFSYSIYDTIGIYDELNGGFSSDIWKTSNFNDINYLIKNLPKEINNNVLSNLRSISLLTVATPPIGVEQSEKNFLQIKLDYFKSIGDYKSILAISELINDEEWDQNLIENIINLHLLNNDYKAVCHKDTQNKIFKKNISLKIGAFCNAMSYNLPAIDLIISLIIEEGSYDNDFIYILNSYLNEIEIDLDKITNLDLYKLNLINNKKVDFSKYINSESEIELQLFYVKSEINSNLNKIALTENLLSRGIIESSILAKTYEKHLTENIIQEEFDFSDLESDFEKRALLYNKIRKTSNQSELIPLLSAYVTHMGNANLLINSANLIYDKIKIIVPKQEYKDQAAHVCLLLLLNDDIDQCKKWLSNLNFIKGTEEIKSKIRLYLSLSENTNRFNKEDINLLLSNKELSENKKNVIAKYAELRNNLKLAEYWKSKNELDKISTLVSNIKLAEYLKSIPIQNKGEMILLISLIHGNNNTDMLDQHSLFLILESLNKLNPFYLDSFVFEYLAHNPI